MRPDRRRREKCEVQMNRRGWLGRASLPACAQVELGRSQQAIRPDPWTHLDVNLWNDDDSLKWIFHVLRGAAGVYHWRDQGVVSFRL